MTDAANEHDEARERDEFPDLDPDEITEDAIEFFVEPPGEADSPTSDADSPPPG